MAGALSGHVAHDPCGLDDATRFGPKDVDDARTHAEAAIGHRGGVQRERTRLVEVQPGAEVAAEQNGLCARV